MTKQELNEIEARWRAAYVGPWKHYVDKTHAINSYEREGYQDIPALIAEVKRLQGDNKRLREALTTLKLGPAMIDAIERGH